MNPPVTPDVQIVTSLVAPELQVITAVIVLLMMAAFPLMRFVRMWNSDKAENSKASAESLLYDRLKDQIDILQGEITKLLDENQKQRHTIMEMESRIKKLEGYEETVNKLKSKLDDKDAALAMRELKIHELFDVILSKDNEINDLRIRIRALEDRISNDETRWKEFQEKNRK